MSLQRDIAKFCYKIVTLSRNIDLAQGAQLVLAYNRMAKCLTMSRRCSGNNSAIQYTVRVQGP